MMWLGLSDVWEANARTCCKSTFVFGLRLVISPNAAFSWKVIWQILCCTDETHDDDDDDDDVLNLCIDIDILFIDIGILVHIESTP